VIRRALWFGAGAASALWVERKARQAAQRFTPPALATSAAERAKERGRDVLAAVAEGRRAMRSREAELRAGLAPGDPATAPPAEGPGATVHALTPRRGTGG
jgi:hypothetical protein